MSIINDALKKAEQFRQWGTQQAPQKFNSEFNSQTAVLEEPPPRIQPAAPRVRIAVQAPVEISRELPPKFAAHSKASSPHSFLIVSLIGLSVLIVVVLFFLLPNFSTSNNGVLVSSAPQPVARQKIEPVPESRMIDNKPVQTIERKSTEASIPEKRDRKGPRPLKSRYQLTGIYGIGGENERYAFINGKIVQTGGIVGDATVVSIGQNTVTLKNGSRVFVLTMP